MAGRQGVSESVFRVVCGLLRAAANCVTWHALRLAQISQRFHCVLEDCRFFRLNDARNDTLPSIASRSFANRSARRTELTEALGWPSKLAYPSFIAQPPFSQRRPAFVWLVALLSVAYIAFLAFTIDVVAAHYGVVKDPGWTVRVTGNGWYVATIDADGPAAGKVEVDDRLLALNGDTRA